MLVKAAVVLIKLPPLAIVSVPSPELPTRSWLLLVHVEPAPVTVTVPREPANVPMTLEKLAALLVVRLPPFWTVSVPDAEFADPKFVLVGPRRAGAADVHDADARGMMSERYPCC